MRTLFILSFFLFIGTKTLFAVEFNRLSRTEPVTTVYYSDFKCYVDVSLFVNTKDVRKGDIFLRVTYIIGTDTLNDNVLVNENYNGVIKQLFLDEGERLTAIIHLNNAETDTLTGIEGSFRVVRNPDFKADSEDTDNAFVGNVWRSEQTPLFRIKLTDSIVQVFRLSFALNENYEFDNLFFKVKVVSPTMGILMLDKEVVVNEGANIDQYKKIFSIDLDEIDLDHVGSYYFQIIPNMAAKRINGVEKVAYEIVLK